MKPGTFPISEFIRQRRSVFPDAFSGNTIQKEEIEHILSTAITAPNHKMTEPWRFYVLRGKSLEKFSEFIARDAVSQGLPNIKVKKKREKVLYSEAIVLLFIQRSPEGFIPEWEEIAALATAVENMWIAAMEHGVGGYWSSPSSIEKVPEFLSSTGLELSDSQRCLGMFYMGKVAFEMHEKKRKSLSEVAIFLD